MARERRGRDVGDVQYAGGLKQIGQRYFSMVASLRSIVDDDDFEAGIFEAKQSPDAADD